MAKTVQIRNMPLEVHRKLKARAAQAGMSLSAYLLRELQKSAEKPTPEELMERIKRRQRFDIDAAELIREGREERDAQIDVWVRDIRAR